MLQSPWLGKGEQLQVAVAGYCINICNSFESLTSSSTTRGGQSIILASASCYPPLWRSLAGDGRTLHDTQAVPAVFFQFSKRVNAKKKSGNAKCLLSEEPTYLLSRGRPDLLPYVLAAHLSMSWTYFNRGTRKAEAWAGTWVHSNT